ncbi:MAG: hypothetical protein M3O55_05010 [Actinomycetota bacterium]|nr:hypothetical protein [Actinomycetota bacterium]
MAHGSAGIDRPAALDRCLSTLLKSYSGIEAVAVAEKSAKLGLGLHEIAGTAPWSSCAPVGTVVPGEPATRP